MHLEQRLAVRLSQRLIMTPSLQQAIKLLQMSKLELLEEVAQEIVENPALEEGASVEAAPPDPSVEEVPTASAPIAARRVSGRREPDIGDQ